MEKARKTGRPVYGPREDRGVMTASIVAAAREEFAVHGLAGTTIRAIARRAGVDPALVHYYFTSKEALLDIATTPPAAFFSSVAAAVSGPIGTRGQRIVRTMLRNWSQPDMAGILQSILLCASHDERTRDKLRMLVSEGIIEATAERLPHEDRQERAGLAAAQIIGLCWCRYIWKIPPLCSMSDDNIISMVGPAIQRYLNGRSR